MTEISFVKPRPTVEIILPDGRVLEGPRDTAISEFFKKLPEWEHPQIVAAVVNGLLRELTHSVHMDSEAQFITVAEADGARIYRRSLTFLLEAAFQDLFPKACLTIDHAVEFGGYYCHVTGMPEFTEEDIVKLEQKMLEYVEKDIPFQRKEVPLQEAIQYFSEIGQSDKVRLLKYRQKKYLVLYQMGSQKDYHHGYMVPSTGYLKLFKLTRMDERAFIIRYPRRHTPDQLLPMPKIQYLLPTFKQYSEWLARLGVESVGALNDAIYENRIRELILVSEALHELRIAELARRISENINKSRIVLIAGPSSSGKTTFSKRLSVQLLAQGVSPFPLELDNYFVNRELTPKDENGELDFEAIGALDTVLLSQHIKSLIAGEEVQLPRFSFQLGRSEPGDVVQLQPDQLIILEGIHGLNPNLLRDTSARQTFRIYISCLTQLNLDRHNRISTTDTRLIRRIIRDARERGYSANETIQRWESVRRGEKRHIFPFQQNADDVFNSALVYEMAVLKRLAEPLLRQVPYGTMAHIEAKRLLSFLEWFVPLDTEMIPDNSILQEFLGNSILKDFRLWKNNNRNIF
ncbi:MAG: nucleoside kinase [Chloroflexi bacterium 44-23]|nr:MAG: nucleoside kinase [Chloroflexi bacterium 44-23]